MAHQEETGSTNSSNFATDPLGTHKHVIDSAIREYNIVAENGSVMDRCVRAGLVQEAYLQAQDTENYKVWKQKKEHDCALAGVPSN